MPPGTPLPEGYGGTVQPDHNPAGLFGEGPQPANNPLARLIVTSTAHDTAPLSPGLAQLALTREAIIRQRLRRMLVRARILPPEAAKPVEAIRGRPRLRPLILGHSRAK